MTDATAASIRTTTTGNTVTRATSAHPAPARGAPLAVVLYACVPPSHHVDPGQVLAQLGRYAAANGWRVHGGYIDRKPLASLTVPRPAWVRVVEEIEVGRAHGIVAPAEAMCAYYPEQRKEFRAWLTANQAFAVYTVRACESAQLGTRRAEGLLSCR